MTNCAAGVGVMSARYGPLPSGSRNCKGLIGYHAFAQSNWSPPEGAATVSFCVSGGAETLARVVVVVVVVH